MARTTSRRPRTAVGNERADFALFALVALLAAGGLAPTSAQDDEVVVVVSANNPVGRLSRLLLGDIFLGRADAFPDGRPAVPVDQPEGSPAYAAFYSEYLRRSPAEIKSHWSKVVFTGRGRPPRSVAAGEAVRRAVAADPRLIGYLERSLVDDSVRVVSIE